MALVVGEIKPGFATDVNGMVLPDKVGNATVLVLPREWDGDQDIPWGRVWVRLGCDFGTAKLRVMVFAEARPDGRNGWRDAGPVIVDAAKGTVLVDPWEGATKMSICRIPQSATDSADNVPIAYLVEAVLKA
jgi:hypothetical protein